MVRTFRIFPPINITRMANSRNMRLAVYVADIVEIATSYTTFYLDILKWRYHLRGVGVGERVLLKCIL
jgi:hypothetical protein